MTIVAAWSGDGLAAGTAVDTSTAGGGDTPFDTVTAGAFTVAASGLHSPRIQADQQAATDAQLMWTTTVLGTLGAHAVRVYVELSAHPPGNARLLAAHDASNVLQWWLDVTSAGILRLRDPGGSAKDTSALALATGTELRLEVVADGAGAVTATVYTGDGTTAWDTLSGTGFGTTVQQLRVLNPATSPTWPTTYVDAIAVSDTAAEIGPVPAPPEPGPVFPDAPLKVDVELQIGDTWERITGDGHTDDPISIERGRANEASQVTPSKLALTLRNTAGKYSPRNPRSPYFGLIGRNTPIRVRVDHPDLPLHPPHVYMPGVPGHYLSTPDAASLDLTDVVDVRMEITPDTWRPAITTMLASKMDWHDSQDSWSFMLLGSGQLRFRWTTDGGSGVLSSNSTDVIPATSGRLAVRIVFDGTDAAHGGNRTYTFYTAASLAGPWTQLGDTNIGDGAGAIYVSTAPVEIGTGAAGTAGFGDLRVFHGDVWGFELADGTGAVVADPGLADLAEGVTSWTGPDGRAWTAHGAARILTGGPANRFVGEVSEWPPKWSLGGHKQTVPIAAAGVKRRLQQGAPPVQSPLRRSIPATSGVVAYWPMEDAGGRFASALPGLPALRLDAAGIDYAADDGFVGAAPLPRMGTGRVVGQVPGFTPQPAGAGILAEQSLMFLLALPDSALDGARRIAMLTTTGEAARWDLWYSAASGGVLGATVYDRQGEKLDEQTSPIEVHGRLLRVAFSLYQFSTNSLWEIMVLPQGGDVTDLDSYSSGVTESMGTIRTVTLGDPADLGDTVIGHATLYDHLVLPSDLADEFSGYDGERAAVRLARLAVENDVPMQIVGELAGTAAMGPQKVDTLLTLLEECAEADGGILGEARDEAGFLYRTRASLYNQAPALELEYAQPGLAAPFEPTDDDQAIANDVTASRTGGSSARAVLETGPLSILPPPAGVGTYDGGSVEVNVASDDQLPDIAGWLLHLGTWDEARYPGLGVKLHKAPGLLAAAAGMDFGDRATVTGMPEWLPPEDADQLVQGYAEVIELLRWRIDCNATPARPWRVWQLETAGFDRIDTAGSELAGAVDADATALTVTTTDGPAWTTDAADLPLTVVVGAEEMTVTAITGETSPQTFTVVRAANGVTKSHAAGTAVVIADPVVIAL